MTIIDAINRIDSLKPNRYEQREKIKWLSGLDAMVFVNVISKHEGAQETAFNGYDADTDLNTKMYADAPYDDIYLYWLESQIDYWNGDTAKYNNSISMFNSAYTAFSNHYTKTHMPKSTRFKFF